MRKFKTVIAILSILNGAVASARGLTMDQVVGNSVGICSPVADNGALRTDMGINLSGNALSATEREKIDRILLRAASYDSIKPHLQGLSIEVLDSLACGNNSATGCTVRSSISIARSGDGRAYDTFPKQLGIYLMEQKHLYSGFNALGNCNFKRPGSRVSEQFGTGFAAMLYSPDAYRRKCPRHFDFMVTNIFGGVSPRYSCASGSVIADDSVASEDHDYTGGDDDAWKETKDVLGSIFTPQNVMIMLSVGMMFMMIHQQNKAAEMQQELLLRSNQPPPVLPAIREAPPVPGLPNNGPPAFIPIGP